MTDEIAEKASKLYKRKLQLTQDINELINHRITGLSLTNKKDSLNWKDISYYPQVLQLSDNISDKLYELALKELQTELNEVDEELKLLM